MSNNLEKIRLKAMDFIIQYGSIDGGHHKMWCLDQVLRILAGNEYEKIVSDIISDGYRWEEGIPP